MTTAGWQAAGREVAVIGLGASGIAATRLLRAAGVAVYASDAGRDAGLAHTAEVLAGLGASVELGGHDLARIAASGGVVLSPGVPPGAPPVRAAREAGVEIRAEVDLGLEAMGEVPWVGITGTNGKTTTTALVEHLLKAAGLQAQAAGNIGTPLCEVARGQQRPEWLAVELSSFQLHDCHLHRPTIGILTNLSPDHLDRYDRLEDYYADKARLFLNAEAASTWVLNADDPGVLAMAAGVPGRRVLVSIAGEADAWFDRAAGRLMLHGEALIDRRELLLLGDHNVANALMAAAAARATGAPTDRLAAGLRTFRALGHRLEPVAEVDGVLWINDSKATNVASTEVALAAMDRPFVLLLGGRHKGEPYSRLAPLLAGRCRGVVAYGEAESLIVHDLAGQLPVAPAGMDWDAVIASARALARAGDAVLLSPACSSYDMFANYGERGARFRAAALSA